MIPRPPNHPLADTMPKMSAQQLADLSESIVRSGQREPVVLFEGKILDGRNRWDACDLAKLEPRVRQFGDDPHDGDSPTRFVLDKNFERRHLTTGQQAAVGALMMPFFEAEAAARQSAGGKGLHIPEGDKGTAVEQAAKSVGVSGSTMAAVVKLQQEAPAKFEEVKAGTKSVHAATTEAADDARKLEEEQAAADLALKTKREEHAAELTKRCGEAFGEAFVAGTILKTEAEVDAFVACSAADQKLIRELVIRDWKVGESMKFIHRAVGRKDEVSELFLRVLSSGKKSGSFVVDGWEVTVRKTEEAVEPK